MPYRHEGATAPDGAPLDGGAFDCTTQYRLHLSDAWPFRESMIFDLEHGPESDMPTWNVRSMLTMRAASFPLWNSPTPMPASIAAPRAVDSSSLGRSTVTPEMSL